MSQSLLKSGRSGPYNSSLFSARPIYPEEREIERNISLGVIVVVTLVSGALFVLNFILISCYVKRKADGGKLLLGKHFKFNKFNRGFRSLPFTSLTSLVQAHI